MDQRTLKGTDLKVSRVCLGTMTFGRQASEAAAKWMVATCLDAGVNFFDTANIYVDGASEEILGRALGSRRGEVVVASKVGGLGGKSPSRARLRKELIIAEAERSLKRLGTEYLDVYYLHQPDYEAPVEETLSALEELVRAGKIRYPATSNYAAWQVAEMLGIAAERAYRPVTVAQQMYNVLARRLETEFVPMAEERGVSIIAYNPLAGGLLTGKHRPGEPTPGTRFDGNTQYQTRYWQGANFSAVHELGELASSHGWSTIEVSMSWLLHHTATDCVILGASRQSHLEENIKATTAGPLPQEILDGLEKIWVEVGGVAPTYNR